MNVLLETLIPLKKVLTLAGIELESPRWPVGNADHSATRPEFFKKYFSFITLKLWIPLLILLDRGNYSAR